MDGGEKNESPPDKVASTLDSASKSVALCVAVLYVCGYLITSLHDFSYGFSESNPLRPRILTAGAWFLLSLSLPFALVRELLKHKTWNGQDKWWFKTASLTFTYWISCNLIFLAAGNAFVFDDNVSSSILPTWKFVTTIVLVVLIIVVLVMLPSKIQKIVLAAAFTTFMASLLWQAYAGLEFDNKFLRSAPTLWMIGVGAICLYEMRIRSWLPKIGDWPHSLITLLALLLVFSTQYYSHIKSSWGGGMPIAVTITFSKDSVVFPNQNISCILIEETDAGFYVAGPADKHATFLPRAAVGLIHFTDSSEPSIFQRK